MFGQNVFNFISMEYIHSHNFELWENVIEILMMLFVFDDNV